MIVYLLLGFIRRSNCQQTRGGFVLTEILAPWSSG